LLAREGDNMPHITLNSTEPGIRGLLEYRPETGRPLTELAEVLLRGPGTLTRGERELIAAHVSALNECRYCSASHAAFAAAQLPGGMALVEQVRADATHAPVSAKLKALLTIAAAFCMMNRYVDGLATFAPDDPAVYAAGAQHIVRDGYLLPAPAPAPEQSSR
jgi:alkylhydroperoxidase family enzyme